MANREKGEALVMCEGGRELTLRFDFDAFCAIEDLADMRINEVLAEMAGPPLPGLDKPSFRQPKMKTQKVLLYGATRAHHPDMTLLDCEELITKQNPVILWPMLHALAVSLGKEKELSEDDEGGDGTAAGHPPQAGAGIGADS